MRRRAQALVALTAGALLLPLLVGTGASAAPRATQANPSDRGGTGTAAVPQLGWGPCGDEFDGTSRPVRDVEGPATLRYSCTYATVPLDYDAPGGATTQLALKRLEAAKPSMKMGTIFLNPGGPGESGVEFTSYIWALLPQQVLDRFDVVGFDPRGVSRSDPLVCFESPEQIDEVFGGTQYFPLDRSEFDALDQAMAEYTDLCESNAGPIIDHMSTADVARDLDLLRRAVGDSKLTYIGLSYGTQLGNVYANMFPRNVRAIVLDGVLDPVAWTTGSPWTGRRLPFSTRVGSDRSTLDVLVEFFRLCRRAGPQACTLLQQGDPQAIYDATMAYLAENGPVMVDFGDGVPVEVSYQNLAAQTRQTFYGPRGWGDLAYQVSTIAATVDVAPPLSGASVQAASSASPGSTRAAAASAAFAATSMGQTFEDFDGVACADTVNPRSRESWWTAGQVQESRYPYFGALWTWSSAACADWPGDRSDRYMGPWTARTATPVLVVGSTFDNATPISGAQAVNRLLPGSRLITVQGWFHTSLARSACADAHVATYLISQRLPAAGTTCAANPLSLPFAEYASSAASRPGVVAGTARAAAIEAAHAAIEGRSDR